MIAAVLGAVFFALASYVGVVLGSMVQATPFDDGPTPSEPPVNAIVVAAAFIGALAVHTGATRLLVDAVVMCTLSAIWCTDTRYGIVPDAFTLTPLAFVLALGFFRHQPWALFSSLIALAPFAALALLSKGRGMGWGDVKLAALGGAVLGGETALIVFAASAFLAVLQAVLRGRRRQAIAFAPYLAGAIALALPLASA